MAISTLTIQDLLTIGKNKITCDVILPFIILPVLLLIACISLIVTIIVMVVIGMGVLYVTSRPRQKTRSQFCYCWTLSSGITMFLMFEYEVLELLEITQLENVIMVFLMGNACYNFYKVRAVADFELATGTSKGKEYSPVLTSESQYCHICQIEINERYFHSQWWDCCIFRPNYPYFLMGHIFALFTLLYGSNLALTTVCQPYVFYGSILMPKDCSDAYFDIHLALAFVSSMYALSYAFVIVLVLLKQLFMYIPRYTEPQWRKLVNVLNV